MYTRTDPNIHITKCTCSLILRPKGRAETLQLTYSCQLLAVYIQYKHINYTDISQIKYKHIYYKFLIKVYCVGYMLLTFGEYISVEFLLLNIFCQLLGGYMSFGGFLSRGPTVRGPTVRGPNCPGPNCPFCQGGQLGPGQLGPGAQLSGAQLSTFSRWTVGPRTIGPRVNISIS